MARQRLVQDTLHLGISSQGNRPSLRDLPVGDADRRPAARGLVLSVRVGLRVERLVCTNIADHAWALVREAGKREGLAHLEDLVAMYLVSQQWVPRCVRRGAVGRSEWLFRGVCRVVSERNMSRARGPHLCGDVVVKMTCVLRIPKLRAVRRRVLVDVVPVDPPEPRMRLRAQHHLAQTM